MEKGFLLTIDVEDWFQVENFKTTIPFSSWSNMELRVEKNTNKILDLFDVVSQTSGPGPQAFGIGATFFILGWIAERLPDRLFLALLLQHFGLHFGGAG